MTVDLCALCEQPMKPGQNRQVLDDDRKAHSSCAALVNERVGIDDLDAIDRIARAAARDEAESFLPLIFEERMIEAAAAGVRDATTEAIPSKATRLRRLMEHAAESLDRQVEDEKGRRDHSRTLTAAALAAMVEASTVLRTVAIYVMDDEQ